MKVIDIPSTPQTGRRTSYAAWIKILPELPEKRGQLYETLGRIGKDSTAGEIHAALRGTYRPSRNNCSKLLGEMVKAGVLEERNERECRITKFSAVTYRITGKSPVQIGKPPPRKTIKGLEKEIARLEKKILRLEAENRRLRLGSPRQMSFSELVRR